MDSTSDPSHQLPPDDVAAIDELGKIYQSFRAELGKGIIGQDQVIEQLAICLFAKGHALLMGVPGIGENPAGFLGGADLRPHLQPDPVHAGPDARGHHRHRHHPGIRSGRTREFEFIRGPVFANIVLADEINRAPAKTQSAMLEAMQENKVTVLGRTYTLQPPFFVLATQNPIEQEGTYPLPEAQLDRFMFLIEVDYPSSDEEIRIARETTGTARQTLNHLFDGEKVLAFQQLVRRVPVPEHLFEYAVKWSAKPARTNRNRRSGSRRPSAGVPGRAPCNISSSARNPAPRCAAPTWPRSKTSRRSPPPCSTTGSSPISPPSPKA
jgi:MoxR-like ATPase